jgi:uncharacterized protein YbaR (Trm112 family)
MNDVPSSGSADLPVPGSAETNAAQNPADAAGVDPRLLEILVCPVTKTTLRYDRERNELVSLAAHLAYPIRDGIPIMLPEEARRIEE